MKIEMRRLDAITPYAANAKKHDATQIANVAESIRQFGWTQPLVVDAAGVLVIGHCRFLAAQRLGLEKAPCVCVDDLTPEQVNALRLVDNKTNESSWDLDLLAEELPELDLSGFDFEWGELPGTGFDIGSPAACAAAVSENPLSDEDHDYQSFVEKFKPKKRQTTVTRRKMFTRWLRIGLLIVMAYLARRCCARSIRVAIIRL